MEKQHYIKILKIYLPILLALFSLSLLVAPYWPNHLALLHTSMELICVFIAMSSFFIIYHVYPQNKNANLLMGLGFLMIGIFDLFHTFYYQAFSWHPQNYYDVNTRFWILGRLTEAILFLIVTTKIFRLSKLIINRYIGLLVTLTAALGISLLILYFPQAFPVLLIKGYGVTKIKVIFEYIIITLLIISIYFLLKQMTPSDFSTEKYILLALLLAIPAELSFTLYTNITDYTQVLGHALKVCCYYYFFMGIFMSSISFPYQELEKSQNIMNKVFNYFPLAIITFDNDYKVTFVNTRAKEILGCGNQDLTGLHVNVIHTKFHIVFWNNDYIYKGNKSESKNNLCNLTDMQGKKNIITLEIYDLRRYGSMYIFDEAKKDQELENLQLQTKTLLNAVNHYIIILNSNSEVVMCNDILLNELNIQESEIKWKNINQVSKQFSMTDMKGATADRNILDGKPFDISIINSRGEKLILSGCSSPIYNVENERVGTIIVASDITEKEKIRVLMQQQEKLATLGQMAAGIVHEIKNPLTAIKGFNQMIIQKTNEDLIKEFAEIIEDEVDQVNRVVTDFLSFAKPRKPEISDVSLSALLKSVENMIETQLFISGISFEMSLPPEERSVLIDESQIKQVILNIVKNAIEAMEYVKKPMLWIKVQLLNETGEMKISIKDNGKGISPEDKKRLGTPFFTTKEKGTGLGLSICYQIVKENNGVLTYDSEPEQGTTFNIILPCNMECKVPREIA